MTNHGQPLYLMPLRSLPKDTRADVERFLSGQTRPLIEGDVDPYGWCYRWDFRQWMELQRIAKNDKQAERIYRFIWD